MFPFPLHHCLLDIHEERVGALHKALPLMLTLVKFLGRVEQIDIRLQHLHNVFAKVSPKRMISFLHGTAEVLCINAATQVSACPRWGQPPSRIDLPF